MWSRDLSLLMFLHQDDGFMVMTDTLATSPDGEPMAFTDKCWVLPSMNLIVATTGIKDLGARWVDVLYNRMLARDIAMLDLYAPDGLRRIWSDLVDEYGDLDGGTSTVYHFGIEAETGQMVRYIYRSTADFETEATAESSFGIKPPPAAGAATPDGVSEWIDLAERVRTEQEATPTADRVHIG